VVSAPYSQSSEDRVKATHQMPCTYHDTLEFRHCLTYGIMNRALTRITRADVPTVIAAAVVSTGATAYRWQHSTCVASCAVRDQPANSIKLLICTRDP
jgi:hypothetical protein